MGCTAGEECGRRCASRGCARSHCHCHCRVPPTAKSKRSARRGRCHRLKPGSPLPGDTWADARRAHRPPASRVTDLGLGGRLLHVTPRDRATSTCVFAFVCVSCARAVPLAGHGGLGRVSVVCTPSGSRHGAAPRRLVSCGCRNAVAPRVPTCWIPTRAASPSLWLLASYAHGTAR
jgi:hypothetical protein